MSDAQPPAHVEPVPEGLPTATPEAERYPFWGYGDLLLFAGLAIPCLLLGAGLVKLVLWMFHIHPAVRAAELLPEQFLGYVLLFGMLRLIFRLEYERPFWSSLAWTDMRAPLLWIVIAGFSTAYGVALLGNLFQMPNTSTPMMDLLKDRTSVILMAIFGIAFAPLCEELIFRGFLQPLLVGIDGAAGHQRAAAPAEELVHGHARLAEGDIALDRAHLEDCAATGLVDFRHRLD